MSSALPHHSEVAGALEAIDVDPWLTGGGITRAQLIAGVALRIAGLERSQLASLHWDDLALASACLLASPAALVRMQQEVAPSVDMALRRIDAAQTLVEEVREEIVESLLHGSLLVKYSGRGRLKSWLGVVATRRLWPLANRKLPIGLKDTLLARRLAAVESPESAMSGAQAREAFQVSIGVAVKNLSELDRQCLRIQLDTPNPFDWLAQHHGVHRSTASRWARRARHKLLQSIHEAMAHELRAKPAEMESELRNVSARYYASLRRLLDEAESA